jgi:hypothetical protein
MERTSQYVQSKKVNATVYVQGIISFAVFILSVIIAVVLYVPYIKDTTVIAEKRRDIEKDVSSLQTKYSTISNYGDDIMAEELEAARYFIPDEMRVAQLATFINNNAKNYGLTVSRLGINEQRAEVKQVDTKEQAKLLGSTKTEKKIFLGRVEGPFSFRGTREQIYQFLDFLVVGGYATNFDEVSITTSGSDDEWSVSLFASYYYLQALTGVEPGRVLQPIQKNALKPISTVPAPSVIPSETVIPSTSIVPSVTGTISTTPTPMPTATVEDSPEPTSID